ncbi:MAG TPA: response regulator [Bacteroidales bacterium]|nr:response regulator [Bacteroidales bacterium]
MKNRGHFSRKVHSKVSNKFKHLNQNMCIIPLVAFSLFSEDMYLDQIDIVLIVLLLFALILVLIYSRRMRKYKKLYQEKEHKLIGREQKNAEIIYKFFRNISHDIRTPLNGIVGSIDLLKQSALNQNQKQYAKILEDSSEYLNAVITNLIDITTLNKPDIKIPSAVFSLQELYSEISTLVTDHIYRKHLILNSYIDPKIPYYLEGEVSRLRVILLSFLNTSIHYTSKGEIFLSAEIIRKFDSYYELKFQVSDTGIPLSENEYSNLFLYNDKDEEVNFLDFIDPDYRYKIPIARKILHDMGCKVAIESRPGFNNSIWFSLIFKETTHALQPFAPRKEIMQGLRVLLIDENIHSKLVLRHYLQFLEIDYREAENFEQGLNLFTEAIHEGRYFNFIIFSIQAWDKNFGIPLAVLKKVPSNKNPVVIGIFNIADIDSIPKEALEYFDELMIKPVRIKDLYEMLIKNAEKLSIHPPKPEPQWKATRELRILLAEDNLINQKVAQTTLQKLGHKVDVASNGQIALKCFQENEYDLIFMDVQMPEMDGIEATKRIREIERQNLSKSKVTIIALTAEAFPGDRDKCISAGMDGYISKPFKINELVELINKVKI